MANAGGATDELAALKQQVAALTAQVQKQAPAKGLARLDPRRHKLAYGGAALGAAGYGYAGYLDAQDAEKKIKGSRDVPVIRDPQPAPQQRDPNDPREKLERLRRQKQGQQ